MCYDAICYDIIIATYGPLRMRDIRRMRTATDIAMMTAPPVSTTAPMIPCGAQMGANGRNATYSSVAYRTIMQLQMGADGRNATYY